MQDPEVHVKHLKPSPPASAIVDRCIECGFCESNCPSRDITLTPRQRITTYREISRLRTTPNPTPDQKQRYGSPSILGRFYSLVHAVARNDPPLQLQDIFCRG
jgi:D-lactate dehydrogenase